MRPPQHPQIRRRSTDDRTSEYELTSLNSTLNKFVGGRQKSWMMNPNSSPQTTVTPLAKPPIPAPAPEPKSPISIQPGDSENCKENPSTLEKGREGTSNSTQDQDGSIASGSKQPSVSPAPLGSPVQPGPASPPASPQVLNLQVAQKSMDAPTVDRQTTVLPSPDPSHDCATRASSDVGPSDSSIPGAVPLPQHQPACPRPLWHKAFVAAHIPNCQYCKGFTNLDGHRDKRARIDSATLQPHRPQNTAPANTQPPPSMMDNDNLMLLPAEPFSLTRFASLLNQVSAIPGSYEASRVSLLRNACLEDDLFYAVLHQVYCLSTVSRSSLDPSTFGARQMAGLDIISCLVVKNEHLSIPFVQACAKFPAHFGDLLRHCVAYRNVLKDVTGFLENLADRWVPFETSIATRNYPPLIDELVAILGLPSPILQHIIFVACCRCFLGGRNEALIQTYTSIFRKNQDFYRQRLSRMHSADAVPLAQMQIENEFLLKQYRQIWQQHLIHGGIDNQQRQQNRGTNIPVTNTNRPQVQTHGSSPPLPQQATIPRAYHQVRPSYPPVTQNTTQNRPRGLAPAIRSHTPANAAASRRPLMTQLHPNPNLPISPQFAPPSNNVNTHSRHGTLLHPSVQQPQPNRPTAPPFYPKPNNLLLPPLGFVPMGIVNPNPLIVGLHQAYLKEKVMILNNNENCSSPLQLFKYLQGFAIPPSSIRMHKPTLKWQFTVPPGEFQKFPVRLNASKPGSSAWGVSDGRRTYQLRCIKMDSAPPKLTEHQWAVSETTWPTAIYTHVNGTEHFIRRKIHHGRDLPLHVTSSLKEGLNEVSLTILWSPAEQKSESLYAMAIEIIEYAAPSRVRSSIQHLPSSVTQEIITKRLTGFNLNDDEIAIVDEHITINLVDPFMARIFVTPSRSKFCSHLECFDLETFLTTRLSSPVKKLGVAEGWKCPICNKDARPQSLIIDDFLVAVRCKLEEDKQLDVKAILVSPDGSWKPKTDGDINRSSVPHLLKRKRETSEHDRSTSPMNCDRPKQSSAPEVIELD
ncbi:hypothetical protein ACJ72_07262 [Emergomyces africanus]|uniref:SP-RING-type domain-containing protein n=1 Tax=Emergomyces africanus TaxID=1955775 RepID=A0A1B7NNP3_9EURO|nr:hypothetical protein ACJ72_07262 [Emergomyces africanus]